jgi:hypothetical protein
MCLYNEERPHEALGQTPLAQHYQPSPRDYQGRLVEIEYRRIGKCAASGSAVLCAGTAVPFS